MGICVDMRSCIYSFNGLRIIFVVHCSSYVHSLTPSYNWQWDNAYDLQSLSQPSSVLHFSFCQLHGLYHQNVKMLGSAAPREGTAKIE